MAKKQKRSGQSFNYKYKPILALPLILIVALVPLIVYMKLIPIEGPSMLFVNGDTNIDFFAYYKMFWLLIFTGVGIFMYIGEHFLNKNIGLRKSKIYYPMLIYIILVLLSTVFSNHRDIAVRGFVDRYENMYVLISYIVLLFLGYNTIDDEKTVKTIVSALGVSAIVMSLLGLTQFTGNDFFMTNFGKKLILPGAYEHIADSLSFTFAGSKTVYATLYNINYVGVYMSLIFSLFTTLFILYKDWRYRIFYLVVSILSFVSLLGSNSRAGMFSLVVYGIFLFIFLRKQIFRNWTRVLILAVGVIVLFIGVNNYRDGNLKTRALSGIKSITSTNPSDFRDIVLDDFKAEMVFDNYSLTLNFDNGQFNLLDEDDNALETVFNGSKFNATEEPYNKHIFELQIFDNHPLIKANLRTNKGIRPINFVMDNDGSMKVLGYSNELLTDIKAPYVGFEGRESLASNRGYIWSRTIPMIRDTILIGNGPDTYGLEFPNNDFVGKIKGLSIGTVVDKPHNIYLQVATNTGLLSLVAILSIVGLYIISSFKIFFNRAEYDGFLDVAGLGILFAVVIFLFTGISNDSIVGISPIFYTLMGVGLMINEKVRVYKE